MSGLVRSSPTFRMFAMPSFWEGVGSLVDLAGSSEPYNVCETGQEADADALRSDWLAVGRDMREAMASAERERL